MRDISLHTDNFCLDRPARRRQIIVWMSGAGKSFAFWGVAGRLLSFAFPYNNSILNNLTLPENSSLEGKAIDPLRLEE
jgi:hypothetical protein